VDGPGKLDGSAHFGADRVPAGRLFLRTIRSPHAHARFTLGDAVAFERAHPGLRLLTAADVPGRNGYGIYPHIKDQPVLAAGSPCTAATPVAALVGPRAVVEAVRMAALPIAWEEAAGARRARRRAGGRAAARAILQQRPGRGRGALRRRGGRACRRRARGTRRVAQRFRRARLPRAGGRVRGPRRRDGRGLVLDPGARDGPRGGGRRAWPRPDAGPHHPSACGGGFGGKLDAGMQPCWQWRPG
jgi:hypothetical protein